MSGFLGVPVDAAYHLVFALTQLLAPFAGGLAAAAAIILFTAAVRLLISPLSLRALRGQAAMARLAPQVQALRKRYGRRPERFQRELTALYKREGTSPFSGLVPLLVQWPFLSVMYLVFRSATVHGAQNQLLSDGLFGVPLGAHWLSGAGLVSVHDVIFLAVFAVIAALCWLSARLAKRSATAAVPAAGGTEPRPGDGATAAARVGDHRKAASHAASGRQANGARSNRTRGNRTAPPAVTTGQDPAEALANGKAGRLLTQVLPYVTVVIAAFAPLAAGLYLLTTVAWTIGERRLFMRHAARAAEAGAKGTGGGEGAGATKGAGGSAGAAIMGTR